MARKKSRKEKKVQPRVLSVSETKINSTETKSLDDYIGNNGFYVLLGMLGLVGFFVFKDYLLLNKTYLFKDIGSDTVNFYYPNLIHVSEYLRDHGIPTWSFQQGMGQNIFGLSFNEPFNWILYALGKDILPYGIAYVELLKIFLVGIFFYKFLRLHKVLEYVAIIGALYLAFSGLMVLGGGWYVFSTEGVHFTMLLFAIELYYRKGSWLLLSGLIGVIGLFQPFNLFLAGLLVLFYSIFRTWYFKTDDIKGYFSHMLKILTVSILGGLTTVFVSYSHLVQALNSPRVGGESSFFAKLSSKGVFFIEGLQHNVTVITRFFSNDLLGTGMQFKGWYNYLEAPIFYCGILTLLLFTHALSHTTKAKKRVLITALALIFVPIIFPFFRYAFWLFAGDYYRVFSFFVALGLVLFAVKSLQSIFSGKEINKVVLFSTLCALLFLLYNPYLPDNIVLEKGPQNFIAFSLVVYTLLILNINRSGLKVFFQTLLIFMTVFELSYLSSITVNNRDVIAGTELSQKKGYNDYTVESLDYINGITSDFYRLQKDFNSGLAVHQSYNDAKAFGYKGTPSYHSFNQKSYIEFLTKMEVIDPTNENQTRWSPGVISRPLLQCLMSVKYKISKFDNAQKVGYGYKQIANFGDAFIYSNAFSVPLGVCYKKYTTEEKLVELEPILRDITLLKAVSVDDVNEVSSLEEIDVNSYTKNYNLNDLGKDIEELKTDTLSITSFVDNHIIGNVTLKESKMMFLSIPYDPSWMAIVNGEEKKISKVNVGFVGLMLNEGNNNVELKFTPPMFLPLLVISIISILLCCFFYWKNKARWSNESVNTKNI